MTEKPKLPLFSSGDPTFAERADRHARPAENQQTVEAALDYYAHFAFLAGCSSRASLNFARAALRDLVAQAERMAEVVDAARVVSEIERTGVLPDFQPLADALARLDGAR